MNQEKMALGIVGGVILYWGVRLVRAPILDFVANALLKRGRITLALKVRKLSGRFNSNCH